MTPVGGFLRRLLGAERPAAGEQPDSTTTPRQRDTDRRPSDRAASNRSRSERAASGSATPSDPATKTAEDDADGEQRRRRGRRGGRRERERRERRKQAETAATQEAPSGNGAAEARTSNEQRNASPRRDEPRRDDERRNSDRDDRGNRGGGSRGGGGRGRNGNDRRALPKGVERRRWSERAPRSALDPALPEDIAFRPATEGGDGTILPSRRRPPPGPRTTQRVIVPDARYITRHNEPEADDNDEPFDRWLSGGVNSASLAPPEVAEAVAEDETTPEPTEEEQIEAIAEPAAAEPVDAEPVDAEVDAAETGEAEGEAETQPERRSRRGRRGGRRHRRAREARAEQDGADDSSDETSDDDDTSEDGDAATTDAVAPAEGPAPDAAPERSSQNGQNAPGRDERRQASELEHPPAFVALGISGPALDAVAEMGFDEPTPVQAEAIPVLIEGRDVVGVAQTGTGKTLAFGIPMVSALDASKAEVQGIVLVPTRELAQQVEDVLAELGARYGLRTIGLLGGRRLDQDFRDLRQGPQIVVGTPGRVLDHLRRATLSLQHVRFAVLDEADQMLDIGFMPDITRILSRTPRRRQTALFSATMPTSVKQLVWRFMDEPVTIEITPEQKTVDTIEQTYFEVAQRDKVAGLRELIERELRGRSLVFCRTKRAVDNLAERLQGMGVIVGALHGDMDQRRRDRVVERFRSGEVDVLIATNVAARGLDIPEVTHVVNYDVPQNVEEYVHRIGRTGRAGREGKAITFVCEYDMREFDAIRAEFGDLLRAETLNLYVGATR